MRLGREFKIVLVATHAMHCLAASSFTVSQYWQIQVTQSPGSSPGSGIGLIKILQFFIDSVIEVLASCLKSIKRHTFHTVSIAQVKKARLTACCRPAPLCFFSQYRWRFDSCRA